MMSIQSQSSYICSNIHNLEKNDKVDILNIIIQKDGTNLIKEGADGCRINLDKLQNTIITEIYNLVKYRLEKKNNETV